MAPSSGSAGVHERDIWLTVPNALTVFRLLAVIPFSVWATNGSDRKALAIFVIAGVTDMLDGTIARRFGQASKVGRLLDPLADNLLTGASFVVLSVFRPALPSIPKWLMLHDARAVEWRATVISPLRKSR
jgi:cardiolipin synthase